MTKAEIKKDLKQAMAQNDKWGVKIAFVRLMFFEAEPYEFRGVSDTGLSVTELEEIYDFLPVCGAKEQVRDYLLEAHGIKDHNVQSHDRPTITKTQ